MISLRCGPLSLNKVFQENKLRLNQCFISLYLLFMEELKAFKSYTTVQNEAPQLQKWVWHMYNGIVAINAKLQVSVQIILYNEKQNKPEINKN